MGHLKDSERWYEEDRPAFREAGILDHDGGRHGPLIPGEAPEPETDYSGSPDWDDFDADAGNEYPLDA